MPVIASSPPSNADQFVESLSASYVTMLGYNVTKTDTESVSNSSLNYLINATYDATYNNTQTKQLIPVFVTLAGALNFSDIASSDSYSYSSSIFTNTSETFHVKSSSNVTPTHIACSETCKPKGGCVYCGTTYTNSTANDLQITGARNFSISGSNTYIWTTGNPYGTSTDSGDFQFANSTGIYHAGVNEKNEYSQSNGETLSSTGTVNQNVSQPVGIYNVTSSLAKDGANYTATVTEPNGTQADPGYWPITGWHGSNQLVGAVIWWNGFDDMSVSFIVYVFSAIAYEAVASLGSALFVLGGVLALSSLYVDTSGTNYLYIESVLAHWWIFSWPVTTQVGYLTNQVEIPLCCQYYLGQYYYIPVYLYGSWHTSAWPPGY